MRPEAATRLEVDGVLDELVDRPDIAGAGRGILHNGQDPRGRARIVRIRDTKHVELLYVSEAALEDIMATGCCEIVRPLEAVEFDARGMFVSTTE
jgi:hypothetical protein